MADRFATLQRTVGNAAVVQMMVDTEEPVSDDQARENYQGRMRSWLDTQEQSRPPRLSIGPESRTWVDEVTIVLDSKIPLEATPAARTAPELTPPDTAALRDEHGMPVENQQWFQEFANRMNLSIYVRPTNAASVGWLNRLAVPKSQKIKAKTINRLDVLLGADPHHLGLVGHFQPKQPTRPDGMSDEDWNELTKRYDDRREKFALLNPSVEQLKAQGILAVYGQLLGYRESVSDKFQPITGDHDIFDIRHAGDPGQSDELIKEPKLSKEAYEAAVRLLVEAEKGVMHGAHMRWERQNAEDEKMYNKIVTDHLKGGEPLIRFSPNQAPQLVWAP